MKGILKFMLYFSALFNELKLLIAYDQYYICRVTKTGNEYTGQISETKSGRICEFWESINLSKDEISKLITDRDFPDGSRRAARNFCRNPNNSSDGPWCYTSSLSGEKENCTVPICSNAENCRSTGPGMEYAGDIHKSIYDNECLHWTATRKTSEIDMFLPEGNIMLAGKSCRNPTGNASGPWCYVLSEEVTENDEEKSWTEEVCNVPICFDQQFTAVLQNEIGFESENYYTHFSSINADAEEIVFSIKLWNPEDWRNAEIKIALSLLPIPANGKQLRAWDIGYEVILRNVKAGVTPSKDEEENWEDIPGLLTGIRSAQLSISWSNGFITVSPQGADKPFILHEYKQSENGIFSQQEVQIKYISIMGTAAFWNMSYAEHYCPEHITSGRKVTRYWPLLTESLNKFLGFHLRSWGNCTITFKISPPQKYPRVRLILQEESGGTVVALDNSENVTEIFGSTTLPTPLSYWKWSDFTISISGYRFSMLIATKKGLETVFDINNKIFQGLKWYGIESATTSHWTFLCNPVQQEYEAMPPECSVSDLDLEYEGHQWVTKSGLPCIPWVSNLIEHLKDDKFPDGSIAAAFNYCRNPTSDSRGTFCFAINVNNEVIITRETCSVRKCKFKDCRIAGTGNDFMGQLSTTITGRTCQAWANNTPHIVEKQLLDDELFPERSVIKARNYCRDPSHNVGGPWCYTLDPQIQKDLCNVPDCYKPTACTVITRMATSKKIYMVPVWRATGIPLSVKMWNPNVTTTLLITFYPLDKAYSYQLRLGDDDNENIKLYYVTDVGREMLLKQKTSAHFLSSGRWLGMLINVQNAEINLSYEDTPNPFFIWHKGENEELPAINATFFSYEAKSRYDDGSLGLNFPCDVCQTELCDKELSHYSVYYPMNIWKEETSVLVNNLTFYVRGNGVFTVNFYLLPTKFPVGILNIDDGSFGDLMELQMIRKRFMDRIAIKHKGSPAFVSDYWSEVTITFGEKEGSLILNGTTFLTWKYPRIPLFYYFSVQCSDKVTWVVNCHPPQLDGTPVNGGWSPWSAWLCSVSCGGGRGVRQRICNQPEPSMFGKTCEGVYMEKGTCNELACGEITVSTINLIRKHLSEHANSVQINVHHSIDIKCNPKLLEIIKLESPKSTIYWNKNGMKLTGVIRLQEVIPDNVHMLINEANISDTGVYACVRPGEDQEVVDITSLIVKSDEFTKTCRTGDKLILQANSALLNTVYSHLRLSWYLNEKIYKEYDITDLRFIDEEIIYPVNGEHEGIWTSTVFQDELGLNWTTSWYKVNVKRTANWATYILEEDLFKGRLGSNEIVIYVAVALLFLIVIAASMGFVIFIIRLQKYFKNQINKQTDQ